MNHHPLAAIASLALLGVVGSGMASPTGRYRERRQTTLEEEEAMSVRRMMRRWRDRERARIAREAAEAEERRPKSRQELRARDRKKAKRLREDRCFQKGERRP